MELTSQDQNPSSILVSSKLDSVPQFLLEDKGKNIYLIDLI
jgi:hypothetical protein